LIVVCLVGVVVVILLGRRHRGTDREEPVRRTAAVALAVVALGMQAYQLTPQDFDLATSLPLALCDLATLAAVVALWSRDPRAVAFTYYVGLTLTAQGILTPSLAEAFPHPRWFGFWALHLGVVWAAAYLTWGLGVRPTWRLYGFSVAATATYALVAFTFNAVTGTNYGYLNRKPPAASVLDLLGPWPWYVAVEVGVIALVWAVVLTLPWYAVGRGVRSGSSSPVRAGAEAPVRARSRRT
jgi:hypothetical integral membrane protein (TIGR02206 family)